MILSNQEIIKAIEAGEISIDPSPPLANYSTSAVDLRVGLTFWRWKATAPGVRLTINCSQAKVPELKEYAQEVKPDGDGTVAVPDEGFLLGRTLETVDLPPGSRLAARVEGRSSLARLGLAVHITAPVIHSGFRGPIVLEFKNHGPHILQLEPGKTCVCQLVFERLGSEPTVALDTVFQNQKGPFGKKG